MNRTEAVALTMLQAGTDPESAHHRHVFEYAPEHLVLETLRENTARIEEAERFLVLLHQRGWNVVPV